MNNKKLLQPILQFITDIILTVYGVTYDTLSVPVDMSQQVLVQFKLNDWRGTVEERAWCVLLKKGQWTKVP